MKTILLIAIVLAAFWTTAVGAEPSSGVTGTLRVSPVCPGPERPGNACVAPLADTRVQLLTAREAVVAEATSDAQGNFKLAAKPGRYRLKVAVGGWAPRCPTLPARVRAGKFVVLNVDCDSGMR